MSGELTRILSDIHFGDRSTRVARLEQLQPLLNGVSRLILNGDTLDTRPGPLPAHTAACRSAVTSYFPGNVPEVVFLTGNHDADISGQHALDLAGGDVFVTHGDIVFDDIVPWSRDAAIIKRRIRDELNATDPEEQADLAARLAIWRRVAYSIPQRRQAARHGLKHSLSYLADTLWPPWRILKIIRAWRLEPLLAARLAEHHRPRARFVVTGHLHRPLVRRESNGVIVINTGSYCLPFGACAVDITPGRLAVRRVTAAGGQFRPGQVIAEFSLAGR